MLRVGQLLLESLDLGIEAFVETFQCLHLSLLTLVFKVHLLHLFDKTLHLYLSVSQSFNNLFILFRPVKARRSMSKIGVVTIIVVFSGDMCYLFSLK